MRVVYELSGKRNLSTCKSFTSDLFWRWHRITSRNTMCPGANVNERQEEKTIGQWVLSLCLNSGAGSFTSDRTLTILTGLTQQGGIDASPEHEICTQWTAASLR